MSLQGSFETISLRDVMTLLAFSHKSGELRVVGGQIEGRLWLVDGDLVASRVGKTEDHVNAMFELLRLTEGTFVFKDGLEATEPGEATPVEPVLREAEARLEEWQHVLLVVPSLEHRVRLVPDLPASEVTLTAEEWHLVIAVALTATVRGVLDELGLGHLEGCRGIKGLVDSGLVLVEPPRVRPAASDPGRVARRPVASNGSGSLSGEARRPVRVARPAAAPLGLTAGLLADLNGDGSHQPPAEISYQTPAQVSFEGPAAVLYEALAGVPAGAHDAHRAHDAHGAHETSATGARDAADADDGNDGNDFHAVGFPGPLVELPKSPFDQSAFGTRLGFARPELDVMPTYGEVSHLDADNAHEYVHQYAQDAHQYDEVEVVPPAPVAVRPIYTPPSYSTPVADAEPIAPEADPKEREPGGESINRGLLLKFLSSVRS